MGSLPAPPKAARGPPMLSGARKNRGQVTDSNDSVTCPLFFSGFAEKRKVLAVGFEEGFGVEEFAALFGN